MDALKFFKEFKRMCNHYQKSMCKGCRREKCACCDTDFLDEMGLTELINDVEKWSKEHPQRTRLQDFLEKYPSAPTETDGTPAICCIDLGYRKEVCDPIKESCVDCWNMPVEEDE